MDRPVVITIAGHDPSGGAGALADALTIAALGCHPAAVVTAITYQNTAGVVGFEPLERRAVEGQLKAIVDDYEVSAVKLGMLAAEHVASAVAVYLSEFSRAGKPVVCDTVFTSGDGVSLFDGDPIETYAKYVIPYCSLITPNLPEAGRLTGKTLEDPRGAAEKLYELYGIPTLVKGGHAPGDTVTDVLFDGDGVLEFSRPRVDEEIHGTGCLLSAAVAAHLATGYSRREAVAGAEEYVSAALANLLKPGKGKPVPERHPNLRVNGAT